MCAAFFSKRGQIKNNVFEYEVHHRHHLQRRGDVKRAVMVSARISILLCCQLLELLPRGSDVVLETKVLVWRRLGDKK